MVTTMYLAHCPNCQGVDLVGQLDVDRPVYFCVACEQTWDKTDLVLEPIKEASDADPFFS